MRLDLERFDVMGPEDAKDRFTVADYAAQALVSKLIFAHFPNYKLVGEEDSKDLHSADQTSLREKIVELANWSLAQKTGNDEAWDKVGSAALDEKTWLDAIDKGDATTTQEGRVWALDPIDGTKGFLRKGQYAVCLALLEQGSPVLGVIGCPNLPVDFKNPSEKGVVFVAVKGQGAFQVRLPMINTSDRRGPMADFSFFLCQRSFSDPTLHPISMSKFSDLSQASFCESVESGHSDQSTNATIAKELGITRPPTRMDSQAKYCSISRSDGDIYLRLPVKKDYEEKIWVRRFPVPFVRCQFANPKI